MIELYDGLNWHGFATVAALRAWLENEGVDLDYWQLEFIRLRQHHRCAIRIPGTDDCYYEIILDL